MTIRKIEEGALVMSDDNFTGRRLYGSADTVVIHMTINPGRAVEPHAAPVDMEFFVLEGRGIFTVGGETAESGPDALIESPAGVPHGIRNPGPGKLRLLAIKNRGL